MEDCAHEQIAKGMVLFSLELGIYSVVSYYSECVDVTLQDNT